MLCMFVDDKYNCFCARHPIVYLYGKPIREPGSSSVDIDQTRSSTLLFAADEGPDLRT